MRYVFYAFLIYLAYQLIFKLVIPVYLTTRKIKKGFKQMQEKMEDQIKQQQSSPQQDMPKPPKHRAGDYIDFEEVGYQP